jgi:hypothetical protein
MKSPDADVAVVADGRMQRDGLLGHLEQRVDARDGHVHFVGDLLGRGLAAQFLGELLLGAPELVHDFDHVHRDADGAGLVGNGPGDGLANPPDGVGGELVAAPILEFLDPFHEADVAFLDQVEEGLAAVGVFLGDGDDQAQVGLGHVRLGLMRAVAARFNWSRILWNSSRGRRTNCSRARIFERSLWMAACWSADLRRDSSSCYVPQAAP